MKQDDGSSLIPAGERTLPRVVIHVPHSSLYIPAEVRNSILLSDEELDRELVRMTDSYTDLLFKVDESTAFSVVNPVSRLVVDPERFLDDELEPMASRGMGAVYTRTSEGLSLRKLNPNLRNVLIEEYYEPHHQKLAHAVQASLRQWGSALIVDSHSFSSSPLPHEPNQNPNRPDICIGSDHYHTPPELIDLLVSHFEGAGLRTTVNIPFSGACVPNAFYLQEKRVSSIMIEVSRHLYMDELTGTPLPTFLAFKEQFGRTLINIIAEAST